MSLSPSLERTPALDRWLEIVPDGTIVVYTGKVELGQGLGTAIAMIAAEELDVSLARVRVVTADTERTPNELVTAGSMSVEDSGGAVRTASAAARRIMLARAADALGVPLESLSVDDGRISSELTNEQTDYWSLQAGRPFAEEVTEAPPVKEPGDYRVVGRRQTRVDLGPKVRGAAAFVHDLTLPDMLHARVLKPPQPGAELTDCPDRVDVAGARVIRDGSFVAVVAGREAHALRALAELERRCRWDGRAIEPGMAALPDYLRGAVTRSLPVVDGVPRDEPPPPRSRPPDVSRTLRATYYRPYQMHASLGPSAAVARFADGRLTVYCASQGVELLKLALADALELPVSRVHVIHAEGAGAYGHNGADDVALDAALIAVAESPRPVRVQWTRRDEHGFEPYAPAALVDMEASLDDTGQIVDWHHETYSFSHMGRPRPSPGYTNLQTAWWRAAPRQPVPREPLLVPEAGIHRNMEPLYALPRKRLVKHFVAHSPLRTSSVRSLGAFANVFAIESFMDELARAAGREPVAFRLAHLADHRARAVLELLAARAPARAPAREPGSRAGRGYAVARYKNRQTWCAVLVDVAVADDGRVSLERAVIAADAGLVIDPDGLANQLEGGFVQAASWTLKEAVTWDRDGVTSRDWESYPILTFSEVPEVATHLVDRRTGPALGAGEASTGPTPAAIANAICDAVGVRVRTLPFTPEQVRAAAAG